MYVDHRTYTDFNGTERTEDFYFNFTKADIARMQYTTEGGLDTMLKKITDSNDTVSLIKIFEELVLAAYGEKSADGREFDKSDEVKKRYKNTQAYSDLFMELAQDDKKAADFVNNIIPKEYRDDDQYKAALKKITDNTGSNVIDMPDHS